MGVKILPSAKYKSEGNLGPCPYRYLKQWRYWMGWEAALHVSNAIHQAIPRLDNSHAYYTMKSGYLSISRSRPRLNTFRTPNSSPQIQEVREPEAMLVSPPSRSPWSRLSSWYLSLDANFWLERVLRINASWTRTVRSRFKFLGLTHGCSREFATVSWYCTSSWLAPQVRNWGKWGFWRNKLGCGAEEAPAHVVTWTNGLRKIDPGPPLHVSSRSCEGKSG